jgi:uncharacterized damage-inducible protein DinB
MNLQSVRTWFAYNRWANRRLLAASGALSAEERGRDLKGSFGSLHGTLRHLLWGERSWLRFWRHDDFGPDLGDDELPDLPAIEAEWDALDRERDAFVAGLDEAQLAAPRRVDEEPYALGELLQHCLNHSTHHRGQVVLMLRQLGRVPPGTGFRQFLAALRKGADQAGG